jgi:metal-responsive CopG/Arc/MetJ family transcriptional regulator
MIGITRRGFSISLPKSLVAEIDMLRGDINRSVYIQRLIENSSKKEETIAQINPKVGAPERFVISSTKGSGVPKPIG